MAGFSQSGGSWGRFNDNSMASRVCFVSLFAFLFLWLFSFVVSCLVVEQWGDSLGDSRAHDDGKGMG